MTLMTTSIYGLEAALKVAKINAQSAMEVVMERKASIGRIVMYQRFGSPGGEHKPEPSPAIIVKVNDEETQRCQLFVMNPNGFYFNDTPFAAEPTPGHWNWPIY